MHEMLTVAATPRRGEAIQNFNNTAVAFADKTDAELRKRYWLFKVMNNRIISAVGKFSLSLALKLRLPVLNLVKHTLFTEFCGGETVKECDPVIARMAASNVKTILDYSVEGEESDAAFDDVVEKTLYAIERGKNEPSIPFAVFKVTGIARFALLEKISAGTALTEQEKVDYEKVRARLTTICSAAHAAALPVMLDAEESWIQPAIDSLAQNMMEKFNTQRPIVYNTIQLYRKDRLTFLKRAFDLAEKEKYLLGVKLVRGAYMEKERRRAEEKNYPSPIQDTKDDTDRDYNAALDFCFQHIEKIGVCAGTHNEESSLKLAALLAAHPIPEAHPHMYFSQLFGMGDHISYNLSANGYNVAKYVPYGPVKSVLPYLFRRAEENSSVAGYVSRELRLLIAERTRRKQSPDEHSPNNRQD
jgi:proline dehydrogenase